jgi:hypothetical protein
MKWRSYDTDGLGFLVTPHTAGIKQDTRSWKEAKIF